MIHHQKTLFALSLLFFLVPSVFLTAQTHNSIPLGSPVYQVLDNAVQRGILPILPSARPYSRSTVLKYLKELREQEGRFSAAENTLINGFIAEYSETVLPDWKTAGYGSQGPLGPVIFGFGETSEIRGNIGNPDNFQMTNQFYAVLEGDMASWFSYKSLLGITFDQLAPDFMHETSFVDGQYTIGEAGTFAPYHFSKDWNGFHISLDNHLRGTTYDDWGIGFIFKDEMTAQFFDNNLTLRLGSIRREWGQGDGSLNLSGTARPFQGLETHIRFAPWVNLSFLFGSLGDWFQEKETKDGDITSDSEQKMYSVQTLELMPFRWLYFGVTGTVVWGKRFEIGYLNPLILGVLYQNNQGDFDNVGLSVQATAVVPYAGKLSAAIFIDETQSFDFTGARNIMSFQFGLETPVPVLPFASITLQYTKIEPFCYAHYSEDDYSFSSNPVSMAYTNDGENLAYYLPPNSDEILVRFECLPYPDITGSLTYKLIRHGTNSLDAAGNPVPGLFYGDIGIPLDYDYWENTGYEDKAFGEDGVYDWTHMVSLKAEYRFRKYPVTLSAEYLFSYTSWDRNDIAGVNVPDPVFQNIFALTVKVIR
jgi:hypothetical protein